MIPQRERTSYEIGIERDKKLRERIALREANRVLHQQILDIRYQLTLRRVEEKQLQIKIDTDSSAADDLMQKRLEIAKLRAEEARLMAELNKGKYAMGKLRDELEILRDEFFQAKDSGL